MSRRWTGRPRSYSTACDFRRPPAFVSLFPGTFEQLCDQWRLLHRGDRRLTDAQLERRFRQLQQQAQRSR